MEELPTDIWRYELRPRLTPTDFEAMGRVCRAWAALTAPPPLPLSPNAPPGSLPRPGRWVWPGQALRRAIADDSPETLERCLIQRAAALYRAYGLGAHMAPARGNRWPEWVRRKLRRLDPSLPELLKSTPHTATMWYPLSLRRAGEDTTAPHPRADDVLTPHEIRLIYYHQAVRVLEWFKLFRVLSPEYRLTALLSPRARALVLAERQPGPKSIPRLLVPPVGADFRKSDTFRMLLQTLAARGDVAALDALFPHTSKHDRVLLLPALERGQRAVIEWFFERWIGPAQTLVNLLDSRSMESYVVRLALKRGDYAFAAWLVDVLQLEDVSDAFLVQWLLRSSMGHASGDPLPDRWRLRGEAALPVSGHALGWAYRHPQGAVILQGLLEGTFEVGRNFTAKRRAKLDVWIFRDERWDLLRWLLEHSGTERSLYTYLFARSALQRGRLDVLEILAEHADPGVLLPCVLENIGDRDLSPKGWQRCRREGRRIVARLWNFMERVFHVQWVHEDTQLRISSLYLNRMMVVFRWCVPPDVIFIAGEIAFIDRPEGVTPSGHLIRPRLTQWRLPWFPPDVAAWGDWQQMTVHMERGSVATAAHSYFQ